MGVDLGIQITGWFLARNVGPEVRVLLYSRGYSGDLGGLVRAENRASLGWGWGTA